MFPARSPFDILLQATMKKSFTAIGPIPYIAVTAFALLTLSVPSFATEWKAAEFISESDATRPIQIPTSFSVSKYGKGKYRLDGDRSYGQVNCIFLSFEPNIAKVSKVHHDWEKIEDATLPSGTMIYEKVIVNPFEPKAPAGPIALRIRVTGDKDATVDELKSAANQIISK